MFGLINDEDTKSQINLLEKAFRGTISRAINRELNLLRKNGVTGESLIKSLARIYHQHNLKELADRIRLHLEEQPIPKIVCSEGLR